MRRRKLRQQSLQDQGHPTMPDNDAFREIDAAAEQLGLTIAPEWKANVQMFFEVARNMAGVIEATGTVATEAAPVFSPGAGR
jgi:hypothetical protein